MLPTLSSSFANLIQGRTNVIHSLLPWSYSSFFSRNFSTPVLPKDSLPSTYASNFDPLTLPPLSFPTTSATNVTHLSSTLTNFRSPKSHFRGLVVQGNREMKSVYTAQPALLDIFCDLFPEIVASRGITKDQSKEWSRWEENANDIIVEWENSMQANSKAAAIWKDKEHIQVACIGGPSSLSAGLLYQLKYPEHSVIHCVTNRMDSNHDGSAYYYHQRDAAPVYVNRVNQGPYCIFIDLYKRLIGGERLADSAVNDRHHVKISLNWANIKLRHVFTVFIPNTYHMVTDLWLRRDKKKAKMAHVIQHACRTVPIVNAISRRTGHPVNSMLIHGKSKACYVGFRSINNKKRTDPKEHFKWLNQFAEIPFEEVSKDGFGAEVTQVLNFPRDGLIAPMIIEGLKQQLAECQAKKETRLTTQDVTRENVQITKLLVTGCNESCKVRVNQIEWMHLQTKEIHRMSIDRAFLSLGPSASFTVQPPSLTFSQHLVDCLRQVQRSSDIAAGYTPNLRSLFRHGVNNFTSLFFRGRNLLKDFILASGSSSVILLGVPLQHTTAAQLHVFSRFIDGVNQHWTLIAQRDVTLPIDALSARPVEFQHYRFYAIQMTGGGNFPSRFVRPDYLLNLLYTTEKMYGLDVMQHAIYDIVQTRGCGRAVSGQNSIAFQAIADNAVVSYALGGIGMTTLFPNGQLMLQIMEKTDSNLADSSKNLHRDKENPLSGIDYSAMIDEPQRVARMMGVDNSISRKEKVILTGFIITVTTGLSVLYAAL